MTTDLTEHGTDALIAALQDATEALAADTTRLVAAVHTAWVTGEQLTADAVAAIVAIINRANAAAFALADIGVAVQIEALTGSATPVVGVLAADDAERLTTALDTILNSEGDTAMQLTRLARSEPLAAAQLGAAEAMIHHPEVVGWVRALNPGACELCQWWARGGQVFPLNRPFRSHPGCNCTPQIVLRDKETSDVR